MVSFKRLACFSAAPLRTAAVRLAVPSRRKGDTKVVSMASCAPCHSVNPRDDFKSPPVEDVDPFQIHVSDERVGPHSRSCFSHTCAAACSSGIPLLSKTPASESSWRPHQHVREVKGRGNLRRRNRRRRKGCASILVIGLVGTAVNTTDANGPC